jgi:tetratricopeptide (TPR) repeat protein
MRGTEAWIWVATVLLGSAQAADRGAAAYQEGLRLAGEGQWTAAIRALEQAVAQEPRNAQYAKALGVAHAKNNEPAAAAEPLGQACRLDSGLPDVCLYWIQSLITASRFSDALAALETAGRVIPRGRRWTLEAHALEGLDRPEAAERQYRRAVTEPDAAADSRLRFGVFLYRQGRPQEAVAWLEEALRLRPQAAEPAVELARVYLQLNRLEDAERVLAKALEVEPTHVAAQVLLRRARRLRESR